MTPAQVAKIIEAIRELDETGKEDEISWIQGYLAPEECFADLPGPVPTDWIEQTMTRIEQGLCPLCPDWDEVNSLEEDFFGEPCEIEGMKCCETCYNVYQLTSPTEEDENPLSDEETYADDHASDCDSDIPVIRNWNDERALDETQDSMSHKPIHLTGCERAQMYAEWARRDNPLKMWKKLYSEIRYSHSRISPVTLGEQEIGILFSGDETIYSYPATLQGMKDALRDIEQATC